MNSNPDDSSNYGDRKFEKQDKSTVIFESMSSTALENPSNVLHIKCSCGHVCKRLRYLKMHQRSCRVISE